MDERIEQKLHSAIRAISMDEFRECDEKISILCCSIDQGGKRRT